MQRLLLFALVALVVGGASAESHVVINEIMYHPPEDGPDLQYIELLNAGDAKADLSGWALGKNITFRFPANTEMPPGTFLVVCHNQAAFSKHYGQNIRIMGSFAGVLSHHTDQIELADANGHVVDSVKYIDKGKWPRGPDGHSPSLERISPFAASENPENWAASALPKFEKAAGTPGRQNDNFAKNVPPAVTKVTFRNPDAGQDVTVTATIQSSQDLVGVHLLFRTAGNGAERPEREVAMERASGEGRKGVYRGVIPGYPNGTLIRFRIKAEDSTGAVRFEPGINEPRPSFSYFIFGKPEAARIAQGWVFMTGPKEQAAPQMGNAARWSPPVPTHSNGLFVYAPADGADLQIFDQVRITPRHGGFKVHFQKDQPLNGMTSINIISEGSPRWLLSEPLAYQLYKMAGVPAEFSEQIRITVDGRPFGYQLLVEQPNKAFLAHNGRNDRGDLFKVLWYEQGVVSQHEKKTNPSTGHKNLVNLVNGLQSKHGLEQWNFIQTNFNVEELINYYAVNMCIQNWDGFFNNYYIYHDLEGTKKWEMYPWDEDKTWGDYDGASSRYDWYEMPLTFGMAGDQSPRDYRHFGGGPFGGVSWWRPPGYFSGPLLANAEFRARFLGRLREICTTVFTEERFLPVIDAMETRLRSEIRVRAQARHHDPQGALQEFHDDMLSFRNQLTNRRKYILAELARAR